MKASGAKFDEIRLYKMEFDRRDIFGMKCTFNLYIEGHYVTEYSTRIQTAGGTDHPLDVVIEDFIQEVESMAAEKLFTAHEGAVTPPEKDEALMLDGED